MTLNFTLHAAAHELRNAPQRGFAPAVAAAAHAGLNPLVHVARVNYFTLSLQIKFGQQCHARYESWIHKARYIVFIIVNLYTLRIHARRNLTHIVTLYLLP